MTKKVEVTGELLERFKAVFGEDTSPDNFYVFEARAISTEKLTQPGTIFNGGKVSRDTINKMVEYVKNPSNNVGTLTLHDNSELNIGRAFHAYTVEEGDELTARIYLALLANQDSQSIIDRIDTGIIDEVSVGVKAEKLVCSECDFDYYSEEASVMNWLDRTCENGHTIGVDGCHVIARGLENFYEVSLVNQGAAKNAKILSQSRAMRFSKEEREKLAASGKTPEMMVATLTQRMEKDMDKKDLEAKIAELEATNAELSAKLSEAEVAKTDAEAKIVEAETAKAEAEAVAVAEAEKTKVAEEAKDATLAAYRGQVEKVLIASGQKDVSIPEDLVGMEKLLTEKQAILATLIPVDGVANPAANLGTPNVGLTAAQLESFMTKSNLEKRK